MKDFTPTEETISLHGLGFIQLILPNKQRLHVWHPELPRRKCYEHSAIHNHRFGFESRVLKGKQCNVRVEAELAKEGTHQIISHNGPRSPKGGRISYPVAECNIYRGPIEEYHPGDTYWMSAYDYHHTPCNGIVITLMQKLDEGHVHANSLCVKGVDFHYDFDRFQLSPGEMYEIVVDAFRS